jgi:hypothetical protein
MRGRVGGLTRQHALRQRPRDGLVAGALLQLEHARDRRRVRNGDARRLLRVGRPFRRTLSLGAHAANLPVADPAPQPLRDTAARLADAARQEPVAVAGPRAWEPDATA